MKKMLTLKPLQTGPFSEPPSGELEGARRATGGFPDGGCHDFNGRADVPDPEVSEVKPRRKFTAAYKLRILQEADRCIQPGQLGALLRREGLYSSNLATWRDQREKGILKSLNPQKRGRKGKPINPSAGRIAQLEKENVRLKKQLRKAEIIIDTQKKISEILGIVQNLEDSEDDK